ncbi:MAG: hypothetical protein N2167_06320 [Flavobacteriales bacterium]|nr:hypothetical protein [Flavobacteriales bacterium]
MEYHFFHFDKPHTALPEKTKQIWFPLTHDINIVLDYIRNHQKGPVVFYLESSFKPYINNQTDIHYFHPLQTHHHKIKKILFFAQSDTLAHSCWLMGEALKNTAEIIYTIPKLKKERSDDFFKNKNISFKEFSFKTLKQFNPDVVIMLNDWSKQPQWVIALCRLLKIPTVCLQESVIDFGDKFKRMQWADEVMIQGTQTIFDLKRSVYFLTGNPRYETLQSIKQTERKNILINCNFTYGIFEEVRNTWLEDIIHCADALETPYIISQHPRDTGDLSSYHGVIRSSSTQVAEQLKNSRCLVTRFSSLIHEALVAGIPVIYYNPHGERMAYDFGFNDEFLILATNKHQLEKALIKALDFSDIEKIKNYLVNHCIQKEKTPTQTIKELFYFLKFKPSRFSITDAWKIILYHPFLLRIIWNIKKS